MTGSQKSAESPGSIRSAAIGAAAALLGGLIGAGATTLVAHQQIAAQRESLEVQADQQLTQFLRNERRETYANTIVNLDRSAAKMVDLINEIHLIQTGDELIDRVSEVRETNVNFDEAMTALMLVAPKETEADARALWDAFQRFEGKLEKVIRILARKNTDIQALNEAVSSARADLPELEDLSEALLDQMRQDLKAEQ